MKYGRTTPPVAFGDSLLGEEASFFKASLSEGGGGEATGGSESW
jgi:hypothetical protein